MNQDILIAIMNSVLYGLAITAFFYIFISILGGLYLLLNLKRLDPEFLRCCGESWGFVFLFLIYFPIYVINKAIN